MVAGRTNQRRTASVTTTSGSANITAGAGVFHEEDTGRTITGTGIPAATTIASVTSDTAAVLSANATASGTVTATLGGATGQAYGFAGWSPETDAESETYSVAAVNAGTATPDRLTNPYTGVSQRARG
ncbi:hypothetical protein ACIBCR_16415 [Micromonospora echinospora]|uniref:hypothetical protein n=1 Tax=Micromonospora echinospora TaxID=1877 RepID=UPI0037AB4EC0